MMQYRLKKAFFFLLILLSIPLLLCWVLYGLSQCFDPVEQLLRDAELGFFLFQGDGIMFPVLWSYIILLPVPLLLLIFYRRECSIWPKLMFLFTGAVTVNTAPQIAEGISWDAFRYGGTANGALLMAVMLFYVAVALAAMIWGTAAMVKYPPAPQKNAPAAA